MQRELHWNWNLRKTGDNQGFNIVFVNELQGCDMSRMFRIETIACLMMLACGVVFAQEHITSIPGGQLSASSERDGIKLIMDYFHKHGTD